MKQSSKIPLVRATNGEILPGNPFSNVVLSSARTSWQNLVLEEHHFANVVVEEHHFATGDVELEDLMYTQHVIAMNVGRPVGCKAKTDGRYGYLSKSKLRGRHCVFPSHQPFFRRIKRDENRAIDVLYVALDPVFVSRTAADLEIYPDRVELVQKRRGTDPAIRHIAMALRAGVQAGHTGDRMYGEALSTALAVHLLREYAGIAVGLQHAHGGLSREKLMRAVEYIHDQLHTDLTVAEIARTVNMSPYHFTRLFKKATGQSPYRYVIEARARKAKELLTSGKFSISEISHHVGFADQSHLTRHVKNFFGVTPKMLL